MLEDRLLLWRFKSGEGAALARIYENHRKNLLRIAAGLLNQDGLAEDVVHDVFLWLARSPDKVSLSGNLRSFLSTCVVNRVRNLNKAGRQCGSIDPEEAMTVPSDDPGPPRWMIANERLSMLNSALAELPYEQREVVILHLEAGMTFREIAESQAVSINTVQSRYRYGLDKLRLLLDGEI